MKINNIRNLFTDYRHGPNTLDQRYKNEKKLEPLNKQKNGKAACWDEIPVDII